jgi:hypothetical protein
VTGHESLLSREDQEPESAGKVDDGPSARAIADEFLITYDFRRSKP